MTSEHGLRERKKAATRAAMSRAALSLLLEQGLDAVTPEAVAEAAEVSPRTFRNYFSSPEEAIVDELAQSQLALAAQLRARPADEPVWDSLMAVWPCGVAGAIGDRERLAVLMQVVAQSHALMGELLLVTERINAMLAEVVAERTGADATRDLAPRVLAGAVGAAVAATVQFWAVSGTDSALPELIHDCLAQLRAGLPLGGAPAG